MVYKFQLCLASLPWLAIVALNTTPTFAQPITPASDGTGTIVTPSGNEFLIHGGTQAGANLFHSFQQFGLDPNQIATFLASPDLQNILGRVTGGDPSVINGLLQVTGGSPNLYLLNPAGIIFGSSASLNVPASFTATTATGIGFGTNHWFHATGSTNYANLIGNPTAFSFSTYPPHPPLGKGGLLESDPPLARGAGGVINAGTLTVSPGQSLNLIGGTVINTGTLTAPGGSITVLSVPNSSLVRLSQPGSLLSLEIDRSGLPNDQSSASSVTPSVAPSVATLPQLLTGSGLATEATGLAVDGDGTVRLVGSGLAVGAGDVVAGGINTGEALLRAEQTLTIAPLSTSQISQPLLQTTGNLGLYAGNTVLIRDSATQPLQILAGGKLTIQGNQAVDIFALNHADSGLFSGGDVVLRSSTNVIGDARYSAGGNFRIETLTGELGGLISPNDPVIRATGNVGFNFYTGASLHIIAGGSVTATGDIVITGANPANFINEAITLSDGTAITINGSSRPTLDIRAGVAAGAIGAPLGLTGTPSPDGLATGGIPTSATITLSRVRFAAPDGQAYISTRYNPNLGLPGGDIVFTGAFPQIDLSNAAGNGGSVIIDSRGSITIPGDVNTFANSPASGGNVTMLAQGNIQVGDIDARGILPTSVDSGAIRLISRNGSITSGILNSDTGGTGRSGGVLVDAFADLSVGDFVSAGTTTSGIPSNVTLTSRTGGITTAASAFAGIFADAYGVGRSGGTITISAQTTINIQGGVGARSFNAAGGSGGVVTITSATGSINTNNRNLAVQSVSTTSPGGSITLSAANDVLLGKGTITAGSTTGVTGNGNVTINGAGTIDVDGGLFLNGAGLTIGNVTVPSTVLLPATIDTVGGNFRLSTSAALNLNSDIDTNGGVVTIASGGLLTITGDVTTNGGDLTLTGANIDTSAVPLNTSGNPNGGNITLTATGNITTGDLTANAIGLNGSGGNVSLISPISITTGTINTSASTGNGGRVFIDPQGDVQVTFINAQGGSNGSGGVVDITTGSRFRATGTFPDRTGTLASISTAGGTSGGSITLRHGGGSQTPFIVGNLFTNNGTAGAITSGSSTIAATFLVPPGTFTRGNIRIITPGNSNQFNVSGDFFGGSGNDLKGEILLPPKVEKPNFDPVLDLRYRALEEAFTAEYAQYLGVEPPPPVKSIAQAVDALKRIARELGVPSALIYVYFVPTDVPATDISSFDIQRRRDDDVLELLMITGDGAPVYKRYPGITRRMVTAVADDMRIAASDAENPGYRKPAQQLYKWIIAPLEADLQDRRIQQLVFLTDLKLRSLPLAALYNGQQFLVERYGIGLMPSFSLTSTTYTNIQTAPVLGMGASTFQELNPLPAIPTELALITRDLRQGGQAFLNDQFTLDNLKAKRLTYPLPILHLATHAEFKPGNARQSYIQLWDTKLRLDQIPQMGWNKPLVELLVLSACRTALGDREAELGFGGIAFQSGVRSVLASLWYVSDVGTLSLMQAFYTQLQTAPTRSEALRQAQIAMARGEITLKEGVLQTARGGLPLPPELQALGTVDLSHPYYWSAFTMIGNPW